MESEKYVIFYMLRSIIFFRVLNSLASSTAANSSAAVKFLKEVIHDCVLFDVSFEIN